MLGKRMLCGLLLAAMMLATTTMRLNPLMPASTTYQAQLIPTRNPSAPPQIQWNRTYGGTNYERAFSVQQTSDGGYVAAGTTESFGAGEDDFWLVKTDASGNQQWNRTYGEFSIDEAYSVQQTSDDGYIIAGTTQSFGAGSGDFWLVKTDASGNQQWNKTYGGASMDDAYSVQQTSDDGYIIAGDTYSFGAGDWDAWLVKTDASGNQQWNKTYGGVVIDFANSVQQTSDGGYIIAGGTNSFGAGSRDFWLVKTDSLGCHQWNRTYGGASWDVAESVQQTSDGGFILAGDTYSFGAGVCDFWLVKTDASGNQQWNRTYGEFNFDHAYSVQQTSDGGYITAGMTDSFGPPGFWLVKTDAGGNQQWNKTSDGATWDYVYSVQQTSDGGYIAAGGTGSIVDGDNDFLLVKTEDGTPPSPVVDLIAGSPANTSITLTWTAPGDDGMDGNATGYEVRYSSAGRMTADNWSSATIYTQSWKPTRNGTAETHLVTGLRSGTTYWFTVVAYDEGPNFSGVSNSPTASTLPDTIAPARITNLAAGTPTNTSINLTWTAPGDDGVDWNATGYIVKYSTTGQITADNWDSATTYTQSWKPAKNGTTETQIVTGLTPGTNYSFAIKAYDDATPPNYGEVSNSPTASTTTGGGAGEGGERFTLIAVAVGAAVVVVLAAVVLVKKRKKVSLVSARLLEDSVTWGEVSSDSIPAAAFSSSRF